MANYRFVSFEGSMGPLVLWPIVTNYTFKDDPRQAMLVDKSLDQLNELSNAYSLRYLYSREDLPAVGGDLFRLDNYDRVHLFLRARNVRVASSDVRDFCQSARPHHCCDS